MSIQFSKSKRNIVLTAFSASLITILIYTSIAEYSISEISPDNYETKVKEINASLYAAGLDQVIPENFQLIVSYKYATSDNFQNNGLKITNKGDLVEIHSMVTQLNYLVTFNEEKLTSVFIFQQDLLHPNPNSPPTPFINQLINNLILEKGFSLKRTELKNGSDFIIKETDNCFIIGSFRSYDGQEPTSSITISTFSKKVFSFY